MSYLGGTLVGKQAQRVSLDTLVELGSRKSKISGLSDLAVSFVAERGVDRVCLRSLVREFHRGLAELSTWRRAVAKGEACSDITLARGRGASGILVGSNLEHLAFLACSITKIAEL